LDVEAPLDIPYTVRVSARAKRVNLHVRPESGLEVVIPRRFARRHIPALLVAHRDWITQALARCEAQQAPYQDAWPPTSLDLVALDRTIALVYRPDASASQVRWQLVGDQLTLSGATGQREAVVNAIAAALKALAKDVLPPLLARLAEQHRLQYARVAIRGQKTRWGSCSSSGTISLNYKLLFLPGELVRYVLLHELAHTRHLDHSAAYWAFLQQLEPAAKVLDRQLDDVGGQVPWWLRL